MNSSNQTLDIMANVSFSVLVLNDRAFNNKKNNENNEIIPPCSKKNDLLNSLIGWSEFKWGESERRHEENVIVIDDIKIEVDVHEKSLELCPEYFITVEGPISKIADLRIPLLNFLAKQEFNHVYLMRDDVSHNISMHLYPIIYKIETKLRRYIINYFSSKVDIDTMEKHIDLIDKDASKDSIDLFKNYKSFKGDIIRINFARLGGFISEKIAPGTGTPENLFKIIVALDNDAQKTSNAEELKKLILTAKQEVSGPAAKYFLKNFTDKGFSEKWQFAYRLRNKVAHAGIFSMDEYNTATRILAEIQEIIDTAEEELYEMKLSQSELQKMRQTSTITPDETNFDIDEKNKILEPMCHNVNPQSFVNNADAINPAQNTCKDATDLIVKVDDPACAQAQQIGNPFCSDDIGIPKSLSIQSIHNTQQVDFRETIIKAYKELLCRNRDTDGYVYLSAIGTELAESFDFKASNYGYENLLALLHNIPDFCDIKFENIRNKGYHALIKINKDIGRDNSIDHPMPLDKESLKEKILEIYNELGEEPVLLSRLASKILAKINGFSPELYGYEKMLPLLRSLDIFDIKINQDRRMPVYKKSIPKVGM